MATELYYNPFIPAMSNIGVPIPEAKLYFYLTDTATLAPIWADADATIPLANPVIADIAGKMPAIYLDDSIIYRLVQRDKTDAPIGDAIDPYYPGSTAFTDSTLRGELADNTGTLLVGTFASIAAMKAVAKADLTANQRVTVRGFYTPGDNGGGEFLWSAASTATAIQGFIEPAAEGGTGRWVRQHNGSITDKMAGAKVDGTTYDDTAITALAALVAADPLARHITFVPGTRKVLPAGAASTSTVFSCSSITGLVIDAAGAVFETARTFTESVATGNSTVFAFYSCPKITFRGNPRFTGPLSIAEITGSGSAYGSLPVLCSNDCSDSYIEVDAFGMLEGVLFTRSPEVELDSTIDPFIGAGGTGYTVGDVLTLSNIGVAATTPATLTVTSVNAGVITGLSVTTKGRWPSFYAGTMSGATTGFSVTGGTGSNAKIVPYTLDYSDRVLEDISRRCTVRIKARQCFYGYNGQWNGADSDIYVDSDYVYRAFFVYGVENVRGHLKVRNQYLNSIIQTAMGTPTSGKFFIKVLPATHATFNIGTVLVASFSGGNAGRLKVDIDFDADRVGSTPCGQYFKVEKYAAGADDANPRGHILDVAIGGYINGRGSLDSGMSNNILGLNVNYADATWVGDLVSIHLKDGFTVRNVETSWGLALNAKALRRLSVGKVNLSCSIKLDPLVTGIGLVPAGPVKVDKDAVFANKFTTVSGHYGLDYLLLGASASLSANMSGSTVVNTNTGGTSVLTLPTWERGVAYSVFNNFSQPVHIAPHTGGRIVHAGTSGGYNKKLYLTTVGMVRIEAGAVADDWIVTDYNGSLSYEP